MTEEQLNEGMELFATIEDIEERIKTLSGYSEYDICDTYLLFDEHVKVHLPEDVCIKVVELINQELDKLLKQYEEAFAALGKE